jgi:hypothetical protein
MKWQQTVSSSSTEIKNDDNQISSDNRVNSECHGKEVVRKPSRRGTCGCRKLRARQSIQTLDMRPLSGEKHAAKDGNPGSASALIFTFPLIR